MESRGGVVLAFLEIVTYVFVMNKAVATTPNRIWASLDGLMRMTGQSVDEILRRHEGGAN